jgi:hypothetical protein
MIFRGTETKTFLFPPKHAEPKKSNTFETFGPNIAHLPGTGASHARKHTQKRH